MRTMRTRMPGTRRILNMPPGIPAAIPPPPRIPEPHTYLSVMLVLTFMASPYILRSLLRAASVHYSYLVKAYLRGGQHQAWQGKRPQPSVP